MVDKPKIETLQNKKLSGKKPGASTQQYLDIAEIRDDCVILKDGTLRAVMLVSSINFALKSEDEQNALISSYVSFLNSIDFPLQVVVQSRRLNIDDYMNRLRDAEKIQTNELLRAQIADYRQFVIELVELGQIMNKRFLVAVPYSPLANPTKGFFSRLKEVLSPAAAVRMKEDKFQERKYQLQQRVGLVSGGLQSMSLDVKQLDTQSLIELYYTVYNPDIFMSEKLAPLGQLQVEAQ